MASVAQDTLTSGDRLLTLASELRQTENAIVFAESAMEIDSVTAEVKALAEDHGIRWDKVGLSRDRVVLPEGEAANVGERTLAVYARYAAAAEVYGGMQEEKERLEEELLELSRGLVRTPITVNQLEGKHFTIEWDKRLGTKNHRYQYLKRVTGVMLRDPEEYIYQGKLELVPTDTIVRRLVGGLCEVQLVGRHGDPLVALDVAED